MSKISFIQQGSTGPIYIGFDVSLDKLQKTCPEPLQLLVSVSGDAGLEQRLRTKFGAARMISGWFQPTLPLLTYILEVQKLVLSAVEPAVPPRPPATSPLQILRDVMGQAKREEWVAALVRHKGNLTRAGKEFGISQPTASVRTKHLGLTEFLAQLKAAHKTARCGRPKKPRKPRGRPKRQSPIKILDGEEEK